ncbi:hypothetical protein Tsubulata_002484 [Turnera subulata]|uniref:Uncharacterized protein n=1 Tax=Turnera subulata TaxID=218843 RepID=A0A9Q0GIY8_9ROSI|nr:hypothetical protein Tsubulata_002484 [Turnera subulata]
MGFIFYLSVGPDSDLGIRGRLRRRTEEVERMSIGVRFSLQVSSCVVSHRFVVRAAWVTEAPRPEGLWELDPDFWMCVFRGLRELGPGFWICASRGFARAGSRLLDMCLLGFAGTGSRLLDVCLLGFVGAWSRLLDLCLSGFAGVGSQDWFHSLKVFSHVQVPLYLISLASQFPGAGTQLLACVSKFSGAGSRLLDSVPSWHLGSLISQFVGAESRLWVHSSRGLTHL